MTTSAGPCDANRNATCDPPASSTSISRLDTLPSELVLVICAHLLNRTHDPPQQRPSLDASQDLAQLARAAPNCYVPAVAMAVRHVNRFCLVKPNPDVPGAWIVTNDRLMRANNLVGCIALDVHAPLATDKHSIPRPVLFLVLRGSLKDGIPPRMAVPCPVASIRHMKVAFSSWLFDHPLPPQLLALGLEGSQLDTARAKLLATHLPTTLRRLWLDAVQIGPGDIGTLVRHIPPGVRHLSIANVYFGDDTAEDLARVLPPALTHLRLTSTGMTYRGLMAVIAALPAEQLVSLDLGNNLHGPETMAALAEWLARTTRLEHLALEDTYVNDAPRILDLVLAVLPDTLRSLALAGSLHLALPLAKATGRIPGLEVLDVSHIQGPSPFVDALFPTLPTTLQVLRIGHADLSRCNLPAALVDARERGVRWPTLREVDVRYAHLTMDHVEAILTALRGVVEPRGQGCQTRVMVVGNALSVRSRTFVAAQKRWAEDGWDVVP
ncbi:hypothetical protein AMAG_05709 [Allomyces macrogynus ATCC 38327]|uniref:F-box domain-containing protein n=1 Tax=Allomyces macrogynus (strain ATCC 38327) TaxID=578462 RepID=A0A0L0SCZ2_ALLM3|nr:hypothetical protein AMAG_05709 [Allomyces macrogynus ATCC 38327]|eukprot:KNE60307.1 hypothetical protein AMAG_05709 [Allomyces macrogynus ATCC 38327]